MNERKRLYKSENDQWVGGVLGGVGDYLDIDPNMLRIAFLLLTIMGVGSTVPLYILLWIFMPSESDARKVVITKNYEQPIDDYDDLHEKAKRY